MASRLAMSNLRFSASFAFTAFSDAAQKIYRYLQIFSNELSNLLHCADALSIFHINVDRRGAG